MVASSGCLGRSAQTLQTTWPIGWQTEVSTCRSPDLSCVVHAVAFSRHRRQRNFGPVVSMLSHFRDIDVIKLLGIPNLLISVSLSFWPQGLPQVPHDDVTSSRAQVNCLRNKKWNTVDAVRAVLHLNVDDEAGLQGRVSYCLTRILSSLEGGNKVGVTLSHTGATRAASLKGERGRGKVGGWWVDGGGPQCPCNRFLVGMEGGRAGREGREGGQLLPHILPDTT